MPARHSPPSCGVDEAWSDLRHHLDWTRGEGTVVLLAVEARDDAEDLRSRTRLWARRAGEAWTSAPEDDTLVAWLRRHLPVPGVLWVGLWEETSRIPVLHALNELRIRLARPGAGCLVLCGPTRVMEEISREASDLWSIRSFAHVVHGAPSDPADLPEEPMGLPPARRGGPYRSTWRITLPADMRTEETAAVLRRVEHARSVLSRDPRAARQVLDGAGRVDSAAARVLVALVRAEVGGLLDDVVTAERYLATAVTDAASLPSSLVSQVLVAAYEIAMAMSAYEAAADAAGARLDIVREWVEVLGTPESRRELSVSLDRVGRVAEARGDLAAAEDAFTEALGIDRELVEVLGTPEARRDLSVSLNYVGRAAEARGDLAAAGDAFTEALGIDRELVEVLGTPESRRDLSVSLNYVGRAAEARGELGVAEEAFTEALGIDRELVEVLGTPESRRDLSVSLNYVGRAAQLRGELGVAEEAFTEALEVRRDLVEVLATPESRRDLSVSLNNVGRVAQARGDLAAAEEAFTEALRIRRELVEVLGTPESRRDLSVALTRVGLLALARGDLAAAEKALTEALGIDRDLAELLGTPESLSDLGSILELLAELAQALGDLDRAEALRAESRDLPAADSP
ncbi:tetratricopeptide repeat protein [Actinomyces howellii]|uniref:Photosystem I assembly protein Ycf3 n=1 Tax=Actinomyces howellii TaxID=52771 RepID=A0A3S4TBD6_9ACTO|nr:tetratricopeptide repeat protein [Actinomyces howellii]VEG30016.1 photosystem I assembly protein Ycf3 [Actinomyces howellii]